MGPVVIFTHSEIQIFTTGFLQTRHRCSTGNDLKTVVSTSFRRGIHVVCLYAYYLFHEVEVYLKLCQTSKIKRFVKIVNS